MRKKKQNRLLPARSAAHVRRTRCAARALGGGDIVGGAGGWAGACAGDDVSGVCCGCDTGVAGDETGDYTRSGGRVQVEEVGGGGEGDGDGVDGEEGEGFGGGEVGGG